MRIQVTKGYRSLHIRLIESHVDRVREVILLRKDEKFRRQHFMLCAGLLKLYFPEVGKLENFKDEVTFDDRGFFKVFPVELIGRIDNVSNES